MNEPQEETVSHRSSLVRKLSSVGAADETFMSNNFFGKLKDFRTYFQDQERVET